MWPVMLSEFGRSLLAALLSVLGVAVIEFVDPTGTAASALASIGFFLVLYVVLSLLAFAVAPRDQVTRWARRQRNSFIGRYVLMNEPGGGLAVYFSIAALAGAMLILPNPALMAPLLSPRGAIIAVLITVFFAWLAIIITQALDYLAAHVRLGPDALEFPGTPVPEFTDYLYLAVTVSATFGTTDVSVHSSLIRRRMTVHSLVAFIFNTVILAAVVSVVSSNLR